MGSEGALSPAARVLHRDRESLGNLHGGGHSWRAGESGHCEILPGLAQNLHITSSVFYSIW